MSTHDSAESHETELSHEPKFKVKAKDILAEYGKDWAEYGKGWPSSVPNKAIYISGPMRGVPELNHPAFDSMEAALLADDMESWTVHSPAATNREHGHTPETPYSECIRLDVESLLKSDAIMLLPGWRQSEGARFEAEIARSFGLEFYEAELWAIGTDEAWSWKKISAKDIGVEGIDQEARRLVYGDRAATYGHPRGDFDTIAKMWTGILLKKLKAKNAPEITGEEVALMMAALKLARLASTPTHHDSQVDTIGYMLCLARLQEDPKEIAAWDARAGK